MKKLKVNWSGSVQEKTRSQELPIIKRERKLLLKSLIGREHVVSSSYFEITTAQFIVFSTVQHANLHFLILFLNMSFKFGSMASTVVFVFFQLIFGLPLYMLYWFLSSYTKRSFFTIWECIPIVEGFGYALAMAKLLYELNNVTIASYCAEMLIHLMYEPNEFKHSCEGDPTNPTCIDYDNVISRNCSNKTDGVLVGTQRYFRENILYYNQFSNECCRFNLIQMAVFAVLWLLIFTVCIFGIDRIAKVVFKILVVAMMVAFSVSCYTAFNAESYSKTPTIPPPPFTLFTFWVEVVLHTNTPAALAHTLWLGTLLPKSFSPRSAAICLAFSKITICLLLMCFSSIVIHGTLSNYKFLDPDCLVIHGMDIFIAFVPDILFQLHFGVLFAVFWYLCLLILATANATFCIIAIVDSLCEHMPELNPRRLILNIVFCACGCLLTLPFCLNISYLLLSVFTNKGMLLLKAVFLILINITLIFLYSITRIIEDYTFTYGTGPHTYFRIFWNMVPIISLYIFILICYDVRTVSASDHFYALTYYIMISSYLTMGIIITPIFIVGLMKIFQQLKFHSLRNLLRPTANWGPYIDERRNARALFFPQREVKYRNTSLRCSHKCLAESSTYHQEHSRQMRMLHNFAKLHRDELEPDFIDFIVSQHNL